jgi:chromosome partitioning protein
MANTQLIAVANRKGGVAKTTTTINLGAALAQLGRRVLLIDLDVQQSLCAALQVPPTCPGLGDALMSTALFGAGDLREAFVDAHGMTVAGGYRIERLEDELSLTPHWQHALSRALNRHRDRFDYVLMDCAPSLNCLTVNALVAADAVLVPIQTEYMAASQLPSIMSAIDDIRCKFNSRLKVAGFLPTMYNARSRHALEMMEHIALQAHLWGVHAFQPIPRTIRLAEATEAGQPICRFSPRSAPARAYATLASELDARHDSASQSRSVAVSSSSVSPIDTSSPGPRATIFA